MSASMIRVALAAVLAALAGAALGAQPAHADAYGAQYWGGFTLNVHGQSIGIPAGQLVHKIEGSGRTIDYQWGHVTASGAART